MTLPEQAQSNRAWHVVALVAGVLAIVSLFVVPSGIVGYLVAIAIASVAVMVGHLAVRRRGAFRAAAIVGLILAYLGLIAPVGLLVVRLTRMFAA
ncbi:hypothetical protein FIV50_03355 [Microbacterium foliorum]|uniref:DUF4190 domain-containing protein n=1 Tax=Microbacterium foliorum TaxID=104336 RepID=A0A4Y5YMI9_9MICO|nr:hypothetical protein [Microbacterium foliorum]QDE33904.1 hypothetical protein FIV50_03355 [Microbacterium foliorum]